MRYCCHTKKKTKIKIKSLYLQLFYLNRYLHETCHELLSKAMLGFSKKLFKSVNYIIKLYTN